MRATESAGPVLRAYLRRPSRRRLARVVRKHHEGVWRVALRVTGSADEASDICQEVFLSLLLRPPDPKSIRSAGGYFTSRVVTVARNRRRSSERRRAREIEAARRLDEAGDAHGERTTEALGEAVDALPDRARAVVELRYFGGLHNREIARILDVSERTVEDELRRGRRLLRVRLGEAVGGAAALAGLGVAGHASTAAAGPPPPPELLDGLLRVVRMGDVLSALDGAPSGAAAPAPPAGVHAKTWASAIAGVVLVASVIVGTALRKREVEAPREAVVVAPPSATRKAEVTAGGGGQKREPATELPAAVPRRAGGTWTLTGRLVESGQKAMPVYPVKGATLRLRGEENPYAGAREMPLGIPDASSDADGRFRIQGVPGDSWAFISSQHGAPIRLTVDHPPSALLALSFRLREARESGQRHLDLGDIFLEPAATIRVRLAGPGREPVEGARITASTKLCAPNERLRRLGFEADAAGACRDVGGGTYLLERVPRRELTVEVEAPGHLPANETVSWPREDPVVVRLFEAGRLDGVVVDGHGAPIAGARVAGRGAAGFVLRPTLTDEAGRFGFDVPTERGSDAWESSFLLWACADGFAWFDDWFECRGDGVQIALPREAVLAGRVVDDEGLPVRAAQVGVTGAQAYSWTTTDSRGAFELRGIPRGVHHPLVRHPDLVAVDTPLLELEEGQKLEDLTIRLTRGVSVVLRVVDSATGEPIPGADVELSQVTEFPDCPGGVWFRRRRSGVTRPSRPLELSGLCPGKVTLSASAPDHASDESAFVLGEASPHELTIALDPMSAIRGTVIGPDGVALQGATVRARRADWKDPWRSESRTDREGRFHIDGIQGDTEHVLAAESPGCVAAVLTGLAVPSGRSTDSLEIQLAAGAGIRGTVVDEHGAGVPAARVVASLCHSEEQAQEYQLRKHLGVDSWSTTSDASGRFEVSGLPTGPYLLRAELDGRRPSEKRRVDVEDPRRHEGVDLLLKKGLTLAGQVVDSSGAPLPGTDVRTRWLGVDVRTDDSGRFEIGGLAPGTVWLFLERQDFPGDAVELPVPSEEARIVLRRNGWVEGRVVVAPPRHSVLAGSLWVVAIPQSRAVAWHDEELPAVAVEAAASGGAPFRLELRPGRYILRAEAPGFAPGESEAVLVGERTPTSGVQIELPPGATIVCSVVRASTGEPVEMARVVAHPETGAVRLQDVSPTPFGAVVLSVDEDRRPEGETFTGEGSSDETGRVVLAGLPAGAYEIDVEHTDLVRARLPAVRVAEGQRVHVEIALRTGGTIVGTVTRWGRPAQGARIEVFRDDGGSCKGTLSDAGGAYRIPGLEPGLYHVVARTLDGFAGWGGRTRVLVGEGQPARADLALSSVHVQGRVTAWGLTVPGTVRVDGAETAGIERRYPCENSRGATGGSLGYGEYALELPAPGTYRLVVEWEGERFVEHVLLPAGTEEVRHDIELRER